jgi:catechol 2,3-dioxygenase-like lactoylglutathione lyase family enzyme
MAKRNRQSSPQLGHLNLKVSDLDRAVDFYRALGLRIVRRAHRSPSWASRSPGHFNLV